MTLGTPVNPSGLQLATGEAPDSLARRVSAAVAAIEPGKRGRLIFSVTETRMAVDLMWKIGGPAAVVARVAKPHGMHAEAEVLLNVNFLVSDSARREADEALKKVRPRVGFRDCYDALRERHEGVKRNSRLRAAVKALGLARFGWRPYLDGGEWFDRE